MFIYVFVVVHVSFAINSHVSYELWVHSKRTIHITSYLNNHTSTPLSPCIFQRILDTKSDESFTYTIYEHADVSLATVLKQSKGSIHRSAVQVCRQTPIPIPIVIPIPMPIPIPYTAHSLPDTVWSPLHTHSRHTASLPLPPCNLSPDGRGEVWGWVYAG